MVNSMKKLMTNILILLCMVCLCAGMGAQAAAEPDPFTFYEDGDVIGFIGDSITHAEYTPVNYLVALGQYYSSRFPGRKVEFRNLSASGYKAVDILNIYDRDPAFRGINKAVIMLGTNEAILGFSSEEYIASMEELVGRLKADGLAGEDILVLTPPVCDQNCAKNYTASGRQRWTFEGRVLEYIEALEGKTKEWGVHYLDLHTPMAQLTEVIQKENPQNSLTTDCIHPNTTGQILIAYYILQAQGAAQEGESLSMSEIFAPLEGEIQAVRGECTDYYRGERGLCWNWRPETLPVAVTDALSEFRRFLDTWEIQGGEKVFGEMLRVEGLSEERVYHVYMGEAALGSFTGAELARGIDLAVSENHPLGAGLWQMEQENRQRHKAVRAYRTVWIDLALGRAEYTREQIQEKYENWYAADEASREAGYVLAQEAAGNEFRMLVTEEGYSPEELKQEAETAKREAEEQARREEEEARKAAEEQRKREEEEAARKKAEEEAGIEAWNQELREREEAERTAQERAVLIRRIAIGSGVTILAAGLALWVIYRKRKKGGNTRR